jgi:hypothetical protein
VSEPLHPVPSYAAVRERLPIIFPEGMDGHNYLTRKVAVRTIFAMLYVGAVEGTGRWLRPNQVARMTDAQAELRSDAARLDWITASFKKADSIIGRWYADNTREPIRDETLRNSLQPVGAVVERSELAKNDASPRWALAADFAGLFTCDEEEFPGLVERWRERHLTPAARARVAMLQEGVVQGGAEGVLVTFPGGRSRMLSPGTSSRIAKAVIEQFAHRFLDTPGVLWVSESSRKDEAADLKLAARVKLPITPNELLPDIILVDLGGEEFRFVFVEVVSSDGPITEDRRARFVEMLSSGGHNPKTAAFVTSFLDRASGTYRKLASTFAWNSFVWFASEPDKLILHLDPGERPVQLFELLG